MSKGVSVTLGQGNLRTFLGPGKVTYISLTLLFGLARVGNYGQEKERSIKASIKSSELMERSVIVTI